MSTSGRPNILFFFSDQQRWDTVGAYGQPLDITPNLDRMAAEGVLFEQAFSCQPVCGPARASLQTGKYASAVGCPTNHRRLPVDEPNLAGWLSASGYEVGYIGKWHLASCGPRDGNDDYRTRPVPPHLRGGYKDYWIASDVLEFTSHSYDGYMFDAEGNKVEMPEGRYRADWQTDLVLDYLESRTGGQPFYLMVSYIEPHHQNDHHCYEGPKGSKQRWKDFVVPGDLVDTEGDWRENYPDYLGCCHSLDANLGRIRSKLEELGLDDNTLIVYTSDHGSHFCTRNSEYKRSCHDGCIHIPMVLCGPGFGGGRRVVDKPVSLIDVPATILQAAGCELPEDIHSRPMQWLLDDEAAKRWPDEAYLEISESQVGRAIRTLKWTYSVRAPEPDQASGRSEVYVEDYLYDNEADPHQRVNLVRDPSYAEVRSTLRDRLIGRMLQAGDIKPTIHPAPED